MTLLVTGGVGLIDSNFVLDRIRMVGMPVVDLDNFTYRTSNSCARAHERCVPSNDAPTIDWHRVGEPAQSAKDAKGAAFRAADVIG